MGNRFVNREEAALSQEAGLDTYTHIHMCKNNNNNVG